MEWSVFNLVFNKLATASVCRFKSLSYYCHLEASQLFGGQLAEAGRAASPTTCPPNDGDAARWR